MRIALFTDTFTPQVNGVARTLERLAKHAADSGHRIAVVSPSLGPEAPTTDEWLRIRLPAVRLPFYPELRIARLLDRRSSARLESFNPDIVHVATEFTVGWSGLLWTAERNIPVISSFHTDFPAYLKAYGVVGFEEVAWNYLRGFHARARVTLCPSRDTREQLLSRGFTGDLRVWPRGVNSTVFRPGHHDAYIKQRIRRDADVVLLYVGRVAAEKRIDLLLEAFAKLRRSHGGTIRLAIIGDGPAMKPLQATAHEGVEFFGYMQGEQLAAAYASADIFAFPSDTETFGNVVLEAAASGLAVVCADSGGVTHTVRHEHSGLLFRAGDANDLASKIDCLVRDEGLRASVAAAALAHAREQSWRRILDGVLDTYRELSDWQRTGLTLAS